MARLPYLLVLTSLLAACSEDSVIPTAPAPGAASRSVGIGSAPGAVFTETNSTSGNAVLVFHRAADGSLTAGGSVATGGTGSGAGLGSQGAVTLSDDGSWLLVVNAGSNDVSSFAVGPNGALTLRGRASSGGTMPISVTIHDDLVYVLNAGGAGNISGLRLAVFPIARYRVSGSANDERDAIVAALAQTGGALAQSAELLGMGRTTLWRKLRFYGLTPASGEEPGREETGG